MAVAACGSLRQGESTSRCPDCATALFRDTGAGGSIYNIASASEDAVGRVARRYCRERGLGAPAIGQRYKPPLGSDFWGYDFSCGPKETAAAPEAPAVAPSAQPAAVPAPPAQAPASREAQAPQAAGSSEQQQACQQQREQAARVIRSGLEALSAQAPSGFESPIEMTAKLPCGEVVCTKTGARVDCE